MIGVAHKKMGNVEKFECGDEKWQKAKKGKMWKEAKNRLCCNGTLMG